MYLPDHFNESRTEILQQCIARHPFGTLITHGKGGLDANHLPFELAAHEGTLGVLRAHVARANPLWQQVANGDEVLVVFRAGDGYVSPNWYPSKHESHRQVPTWNYIVVHAYGRIHVHDDERFVRGVVARLTRSHEAAQAKPWQMSDAPSDYLDAALKTVVGLQIEITRLLGKSKLGQDEITGDILGAGHALKGCGNHRIGDAMLAHCAAKPD
ncbi:FMN-binding negative transcriptional regulator [Vogesella indigofera]|uniref:FMN-binding negative transcriptional regulator n=1 Tax=Vogesella indigofera TaxID=45465 RepID=UPI00234F063E|nr:FMN-binding negative transcriptional regulator [Vogesella indigofera]MDC7711034.1 FMN-binding negative transcriptional regulator [Vogesella indigofera]